MKPVIVLLILFLTEPTFAQGKHWCEGYALGTYKSYRSALLSNSFSPEAVEKFMPEGYRSNIKEGMYLRHFQSLRLIEAKLTNIVGYSVECKESGAAILKIKTMNFDREYNRRAIYIKREGEKYVISSTSDERESDIFDKGVSYTPYRGDS
jgi:hypothetical protein